MLILLLSSHPAGVGSRTNPAHGHFLASFSHLMTEKKPQDLHHNTPRVCLMLCVMNDATSNSRAAILRYNLTAWCRAPILEMGLGSKRSAYSASPPIRQSHYTVRSGL